MQAKLRLAKTPRVNGNAGDSLPGFAGSAVLGERRQHQVKVLYRRARGAFAQVVEYRSEHNLAVLRVGEQRQAQVIAAIERFWVQCCGRPVLVQWHQLDVTGALIMLLQASLQMLGIHPAGNSRNCSEILSTMPWR